MNGSTQPKNVVVIVGGGPAGSATAAFLAGTRPDVRIVLLDRGHFPRSKICAEYVSPGAVEILDELNALCRLPEEQGRRLTGMRLFAPNGLSHLVGYTDPVTHAGRTSLAVDRWHLDAALLAEARERGVEVHEGTRVVSTLVEAGEVRGVVAADEHGETRQIKARVVVGADGLHSVLVRDLGLSRPVRWPRRLGLVAHLRGVRWAPNHGEMHVGRGAYVGVAPLDSGNEGAVSVGLVSRLPGRTHLGKPEVALRTRLHNEFPRVAAR